MKKAKKVICIMLTMLYILSMCLTSYAATDAETTSAPKNYACYYVDNNGSDSNNGSKQAPFQTIQRAKEAVRTRIGEGRLPEGGARIYLRGGIYYMYDSLVFEPEDSGYEEGKIIYTAYPGEEVRISGSKPIEQSWFRPITEEEKTPIIDQEAASRVMVADLRNNGITEYGELNTRGYHYFNKGQYMAAELIVNGENQTLARYPNEGTIPVNNKNLLPEEMSFKYENERPSSWVNATDAWICGTLSINYENNYYPIDNINTTEKKIKLKEGKIKTYYTNGWYFAENLLEEMDQVGEYYIDRENGKLYYLPPEDFNTNNYTIELSTIGNPIFYFNGAKNIAVKNMTIEGGRGYAALGTTKDYKIMTYGEFLRKNNMTNPITFDPNSTHFLRLADPLNYPEAQVFPGHIWDGFLDDGAGVQGIEFRNCQIRNFGQGGLIFRGTKIKLEYNEIKNIGGTGIFMSGGDYETLTSSENSIINNTIHRVGYQHRAYNPALAIQGVGCRVAYNDVYDGPHCIINFGGNDHIFEYNKIHDAVKECLDMDAIYTRNEISPQQRGSMFRNNYIYNLGIYPVGEYIKQFNVCGIRTDNNGHALQIYNNIFANIGSNKANNVVAVRAQGTRSVIKANLFLDCSATYWGFDSYKPSMTWNTEDEETRRRLELVKTYAANPVYAAKYPELLTFHQEFYAAVATNVFDENLTVNIKFPLSTINGTPLPSGARGATELILGTNNIATTNDPGFNGYSNGDYELQTGLTLLDQIPNYKNHNMKEFGPKSFNAKVLTEDLADYVINLDTNTVSKELLMKNLMEVTNYLNKEQYKLALLNIKLFMAKVWLQTPWIINTEQSDVIFNDSLSICKTIWEEAQRKAESKSDNRIDQIFDFLHSFTIETDKTEKYNALLDTMDDLIDSVQ
ncbi:hypothetical protein acsn021_14230 [Anaerocolumna cellulosilytica]|uniref:Uncharacterized protein n=1 Tax=Anaerocolumna cellulosilytica TaxID=433286 RepID=A0A6S6QTA6_9FIRM|nr:right-handed parallel beta-helix repeat-containing protein [Anaerocolumna cellulosilytica]MBB5195610.1 hypothetical protein [Anaerocolumna cellulosilytica]BCJ93854.1 hypothetical protein acsn021_14230 [Anaerocolumna cellulosilytica]